MGTNGEMLDWLADLQGPEQGQEQEIAQPPQEPAAQTDMLEDLREQMIQAEEALEAEARAPFVQSLMSLKPWQRLVLAILLFLNVAVCGCMALVVTGRVVLSF